MKKLLSCVALAAFLVGCGGKHVVHEPLKNELLAYTSKFESVEKNARFLALGTYLNPVHNSVITQDKNEIFIIAIYPKDSKINLSSIKVNGISQGVSASVLKEDDELLSLAGFSVPWGKYIKVVSPEITSDTLNVTFEIYPSKQANLSFQKVSKSMYWN